ncbi:unnamed protein product [Prorocentrum cordatum]|uniref:Uncharacterized protein n=1 Tax=Prorocentrum cordatum TaxID=2364126 RepID=A0ABN9Q959_9DINO|nr:unnamed protein product [Polarella glacialis]
MGSATALFTRTLAPFQLLPNAAPFAPSADPTSVSATSRSTSACSSTNSCAATTRGLPSQPRVHFCTTHAASLRLGLSVSSATPASATPPASAWAASQRQGPLLRCTTCHVPTAVGAAAAAAGCRGARLLRLQLASPLPSKPSSATSPLVPSLCRPSAC